MAKLYENLLFTTGQVSNKTGIGINVCSYFARKNGLPIIRIPGIRQPFRVWNQTDIEVFIRMRALEHARNSRTLSYIRNFKK